MLAAVVTPQYRYIIVSDKRIKSPCLSICRLHRESRLCAGCWRSLEEIGGWIRMNDAEKAAAIEAADQRKQDASPEFKARMAAFRDANLADR